MSKKVVCKCGNKMFIPNNVKVITCLVCKRVIVVRKEVLVDEESKN